MIQLLEDKWELIQQKFKEQKDRLLGPQKKVYDQGERFLYITKDYAVFENNKLNIYVKQLDDEKIKQTLKCFCYKQCKALVQKSISSYQSNYKVKPRSIRIIDSQSNWGTCDSKLQLTFNWRLAMAPLKVIEYVVIHEMCHMVHLNHDRSYWRLVGKIMRDYKEQEKWLE